ncbi:MAG: homocysteine methyltransferase, partial [Clostridia bacterium]|nr:homocysteine methyltransferase [Clostridia bacterium]
MTDFHTLLSSPGFILFDGATGTELQARGMAPGAVPDLMNLEHPEWVLDIYRSYISAGSQIICANTFGANAHKLSGSGHAVEEVITSAITLAKEAAAGTDTLIALELGPIGQLMEPTGTLSFHEAYELYAQQVRAGVAAGADLVKLATRTDLYEVKASLLAVKENSSLPVIASMSFEQNGRTFLGVDIPSMALTLEGLGADVIGINCSLGPRELIPMARELASWTTLPLLMKPNAGLPDPSGKGYDITPQEFASYMTELAELGVKLLGGCCGTTPEYISLLKESLCRVAYAPRPLPAIPAAVCSGSRTVPINRVRVIGERINPTGKKRFQEALRNEDMDYILDQAVQQAAAGADILDVNVGLPGVDEPIMMVRVVKAIQSVADAPLQLDSSDPAALEAGLRVYNGKAIVNSVNGKDEVLDAVLPIVKKYGAAVVGLTLDGEGIPQTAERRLAIARHILDKALSYGIR